MSEPTTRTEGVARLGGHTFSNGQTVSDMTMSYWTMGALNAARDNVILLCPGASGDRNWPLPHCLVGGAFDPTRWFIVSVDPIGGAGSSRRSTDEAFPSVYDVDDLADAIVGFLDVLGIARVRTFCGPSMASLVGLNLAARAPERVGALLLWIGGYRIEGYGTMVIDALKLILALDQGPAGFRAAAAAYLPAITSKALLSPMPASARDGFIDMLAGEWSRLWRADELTDRYVNMGHCDLADRAGGVEKLAASISCPVLAISATSDAIFASSEMEDLTGRLVHGATRLIDSPWGHLAAAAPQGSPEFEIFSDESRRFVESLT